MNTTQPVYPTWNCVGHKPTTWALGVIENRMMKRPLAVIMRSADGSWFWRLHASPRPDDTPPHRMKPYYLGAGREPSRLTAIEAADRAYWNLKPGQIMFHGGPYDGRIEDFKDFDQGQRGRMPVMKTPTAADFGRPCTPADMATSTYERYDCRHWWFVP